LGVLGAANIATERVISAMNEAPSATLLAVASREGLDPADIRNDLAAGRVVAAAEIHPEFGVDGLTSASLDYGGRHASITVSVYSGPTGWGSHQQLSVLGSTVREHHRGSLRVGSRWQLVLAAELRRIVIRP
jgi:hypothetical protein